MRLRSLLFVPADSERKFAKAAQCSADALILDLEDSVVSAQKAMARDHVADLLAGSQARDWSFLVRINPLGSGLALDDLAATIKPGLDGVLLPKADNAEDVVRLGHYIEALEARAGLPIGAIRILVVATETPIAMFNLGSYAPAHPRLCALTWGAEDLSSAIGATDNKAETGDWSFPYQLARAQCLFAASAANVAPIDTLYADYRDLSGLEADCRRARRDGFTGRLAIHPDQVATINAAFSPTEQDLAHARRVVDAFAASPLAGTVGIDGRMYDLPHLKAAKRTLNEASF